MKLDQTKCIFGRNSFLGVVDCGTVGSRKSQVELSARVQGIGLQPA